MIRPSPPKKGGLVFADHAEDGAHDPDAVAYGVQLGYGAFGPVAVLDRHLVESQVVSAAINTCG